MTVFVTVLLIVGGSIVLGKGLVKEARRGLDDPDWMKNHPPDACRNIFRIQLWVGQKLPFAVALVSLGFVLGRF
ncbi:MAG: hypothetical protein HY507_02320 [Candidatus Zambryskibacteria bacterium]|nr:hypothetical protein [Candidatus Zambryskibacteria bacterium]